MKPPLQAKPIDSDESSEGNQEREIFFKRRLAPLEIRLGRSSEIAAILDLALQKRVSERYNDAASFPQALRPVVS